MGTSLYAITNASLQHQNSEKDWKLILEKLKTHQFETTSYFSIDGNYIKEQGNWEFEKEEDPDLPFQVYFFGPFHLTPALYSNLGIIHSIYKYRLLYEVHNFDWFDDFRKDLFKIVTAIGGTEVIFLADNSCDKLGEYFECMALENVPYHNIKQQMLQNFGEPVTNYAQLNYDKLNYRNITEFFLDDFEDLRQAF